VELVTFLQRLDADPAQSLPGRDCGGDSNRKMDQKEEA
jgi:hypothetical protein